MNETLNKNLRTKNIKMKMRQKFENTKYIATTIDKGILQNNQLIIETL